jgi:hypothetical protein
MVYRYSRVQSIIRCWWFLTSLTTGTYNTLKRMTTQNQKADDNMEDDNDRKRASVNDDGDEIDAAMEVEPRVKRKEPTFVYVAIDGMLSQITKIEVIEGNDIDDIKEKIKEKAKNTFASCDAYQIKLFASEDDEEPLPPTKKWNPNVTWGTETQPLIVHAPKTNTTTGSSINSGKCNFFVAFMYVCMYLC